VFLRGVFESGRYLVLLKGCEKTMLMILMMLMMLMMD